MSFFSDWILLLDVVTLDALKLVMTTMSGMRGVIVNVESSVRSSQHFFFDVLLCKKWMKLIYTHKSLQPHQQFCETVLGHISSLMATCLAC